MKRLFIILSCMLALIGASLTPAADETMNKPVDDGPAAPRADIGLIDNFRLQGDLNGDGTEEIVLAAWSMPGGSGVFIYLMVLDANDKGLTGQPIFVGDRVQIRGGEILNNQLSIDVIQAGPDDPACCPTQKATRSWRMDDKGQFVEQPVVVTGSLSPEDIGGLAWRLESMNGDPIDEDRKITLEYEDGKIRGQAGCNSYFGELKPVRESGQAITIGPLGSTRKACPEEVMKREADYLQRLGSVTGFSFNGQRLVLSWSRDDSSGVLVFRPSSGLSQ
ncbi:META domain-containing protein [Thiolapillus sp.]